MNSVSKAIKQYHTILNSLSNNDQIKFKKSIIEENINMIFQFPKDDDSVLIGKDKIEVSIDYINRKENIESLVDRDNTCGICEEEIEEESPEEHLTKNHTFNEIINEFMLVNPIKNLELIIDKSSNQLEKKFKEENSKYTYKIISLFEHESLLINGNNEEDVIEKFIDLLLKKKNLIKYINRYFYCDNRECNINLVYSDQICLSCKKYLKRCESRHKNSLLTRDMIKEFIKKNFKIEIFN